MHLCYRSGCEGLLSEFREHVFYRSAKRFLKDVKCQLRLERWNLILEFTQLRRDLERQQVTTRRNRLAKFNEDRPEFLECLTNSDT